MDMQIFGTKGYIYIRNDKIEKIPRHKEINEQLAKAILRKWGLL